MPADPQPIPRPEHPRPDFHREPWTNLNGRWRFTFDPQNEGEQRRWHRLRHPDLAPDEPPAAQDPFVRTIVVPYPWESRLSDVQEPEYKGAAWYQRTITVPADWSDEPPAAEETRPTLASPGGIPSAPGPLAVAGWRLRPYLCFGAVDWSAKVWVDGRFVAEHEGGYTPFSLDLSRYVRPGRAATLTVRVYDACDADTPLGKQTYDWYTHSGGIWQTVWLEGRPPAHLTYVHVTPRLEDGSALFAVGIETPHARAGAHEGEHSSAGRFRLRVRSSDAAFPEASSVVEVTSGEHEVTVEVQVPEPRAWSPEDPHLYPCVVSFEPESGPADEIQTYFGLRSVSRGRWGGSEHEYVLLNGEPVYLRGALDQAFHPDGLHTYPSDEAIRADVHAAKDLGLNMLRCHIKVNEPRYYYWADRLGVLVMYDLPSASIYTPTARGHWERTFRKAIQRDFSHPSIFSWILFNETWGLEEHQGPSSWRWVRDMFELARTLDPTRLIEDNSACLYDHVITDLNTWHFYIQTYDRARREIERIVAQTYEGSPFNFVGGRFGHVEEAAAHRQGTEPLLNSEYAGLGARWGDKDIAYSFKFLTGELRRHAKVCGYVYTELTDIEWEHNGLLNYDRSPKEFGYGAFVEGMTLADLTGADFVGLNCPPCQTVAPGSAFRAEVFVAHWDRRPIGEGEVRWRISAIDSLGRDRVLDEGRGPIEPARYGVTLAGAVELHLPDEPCLVTAAVWLMDGDGRIRARNYVNVDVNAGPLPACEQTDAGIALRFRTTDFSDSSWPQPTLGPDGSKFGATGAGWVEYELALPDGLHPDSVRGLRLRVEAGARTASARLGWQDLRQRAVGSYPQTESRKLGSRVRVTVNGLPLHGVDLPDDPADARGVLSAHLSPSFEYASYGFLSDLAADAETARRILAASHGGRIVVRLEVPRGPGAGGLNLYGSRMGAYPVDPVLLIETRRDGG